MLPHIVALAATRAKTVAEGDSEMKRMRKSSNGGGWVYTDSNLGYKMEILANTSGKSNERK